MTHPKIKECPDCGMSGGELSVYTYENGGRHLHNDVETTGSCQCGVFKRRELLQE